MFTPIHQLSQNNRQEAARCRERWDSVAGQALADDLRARIRSGAGEDFLQWDFEQGRLGFHEHYHDMKGLELHGEDITFPKGDNFEGVDLSYASSYKDRKSTRLNSSHTDISR